MSEIGISAIVFMNVCISFILFPYFCLIYVELSAVVLKAAKCVMLFSDFKQRILFYRFNLIGIHFTVSVLMIA